MQENKVGKNIATLRKEKGLTQAQLAEKLFVSDKAISRWESGVGLPEIANLVELAKVFEVTVDDLIHGSNISNQPKPQNKEQVPSSMSDERLNELLNLKTEPKKTTKVNVSNQNDLSTTAIIGLVVSVIAIIISLFVSGLIGLVLSIVVIVMIKNELKKPDLSQNSILMLKIARILSIISIIVSIVMTLIAIIFILITGTMIFNAFGIFVSSVSALNSIFIPLQIIL